MPLGESDNDVMKELHEVLKKHNALKRFGITLLHEHFEIERDEVLVEITDRAKRLQTIEVFKKAEIENLDTIETSWRLDSGVPVMSCTCQKDGNGHGHYETN